MRTALFHSLKASLLSCIPKGLSLKHPYESLQDTLTSTLKTLKNSTLKTLGDYLLSNIVNLPKDQAQTPSDKEPPEEKLPITIIEDTPVDIVVQSLPIETPVGVRKKKNILPAKHRNLTWKNNTRVPDSLIIEAKKYWEDNCGILFTQVDQNPWFTFEEASENLEKHPDLQTVVAMAFFPGEDPRTVNIFKRFDSQFNKIAALAHELGHIMGFCHDIDPKKMHCSNEVNHFAEYITDYDPDSIMNYSKLWEDENNKRLTKLSDLDIVGCRKLYGLPINGSRALQISG